jgi:hypothetical protein
LAGLSYDPKDFAGHSLRAGFVTSALEHGADMFRVMDVTRHRRVETLKGYDRRAKAFRNHAGEGFLRFELSHRRALRGQCPQLEEGDTCAPNMGPVLTQTCRLSSR